MVAIGRGCKQLLISATTKSTKRLAMEFLGAQQAAPLFHTRVGLPPHRGPVLYTYHQSLFSPSPTLNTLTPLLM